MTARKSHHRPIIIVGGGAVGSALALDLLRRGRSVLVLEARQPDYTVPPPEREIALSAGSVAYLQSLGVWSDISAGGIGEILHIQIMEAGGSASMALDGNDARQDRALGAVVEMGQLLLPMHRALQQQDSWLAPAAIQQITRDSDGVQLIALVDGEERQLSGSLLVAADGTNSQLRRMAGIPTCGWDHNRFGLVASLDASHHQHTAYECFRCQGPLALLPMADGRFSIVWAVEPHRATELLALDHAEFVAQLTSALDSAVRQRIGSIEAISPRGAFPLELTIAQRFTDQRLALVGNAAHTIHPVAGQGMNLGLRDAMALARMVDEHAVDDPGSAMVLAQYADGRRADVAMTAGFTEGLLAGFGIGGALPMLLRQAGLRLMRQNGGLRRLLTDYATGRAQGGE